MKRYGYASITLGFFVASLTHRWLFGWLSYLDDAKPHGHGQDSVVVGHE